MSKLSTAIAKAPVIGPIALFAFRSRMALGYFYRPLSNVFTWLIKSKETSNFTYDLEEKNKRYLASMIADILNLRFSEVLDFFREIEENGELKKHIADATRKSERAFTADTEVRLGRRIAWYAIARAKKPKIVIETGVDKGLGSCVLAAALKKNTQESHAGHYYGLDINPKAGFFLSGDFARYGSILFGDAIESIKNFAGVVDLYINDSDHSAQYEGLEYEAMAQKLSAGAIILGDNAHASDKLLEFSLAQDRHFVFFQDRPLEHWYPGTGMGISFKR